ncbi:MAG: hypothetical protein LCH84_11440 [Gemmatimonadetes bacterium]|nr:hypothetical protein [Gemmatimonadota bacterium]
MIVRLRILLLVAGISAFAFAMRTGQDMARYAGIAFVALALLLRFVKPRG